MSCRKSILFLSVAGLLYLAAIVVAGVTAEPRESDIAVVLGNEVLANGKPSDRLTARLDCAVSVYKRHLAPLILVSGGVGKSGYDEATVMGSYLLDHGVPADAILTDSKGVNTRATAVNTLALAKTRHFSRILIVTQYYHIPRTMMAFRQEGPQSLSADYPRYFELGDLFAIAREGIALPVYLAKIPGNK